MTLWLTFTALTAAVLALLLYPLRRKTGDAPSRADYDLAIYRDQLAEVERDIKRNLLTPDQANAARAEIHRRMLAVADARTAAQKSVASNKMILASIIVIGLPVGAGLTYMQLGHPELPGKPYAARQHDPDFILTSDAEQLATQLEINPDAEGYQRLADIWFILRRYDKVAEAYRKIIDLDGGNAATWSSLGEATAFSNGGEVTPEARQAFTKAFQLDAHDSRAQFYLGLAEAQAGEPRHAIAMWRNLEKDSPPDAPWLPMLKKQIAMTAKQGGFDPESVSPAPSPSNNPDAAGIMAMNPSDQNAAIHNMVDRLALRMKNNPDDPDGWLRLAKAYRVLGETGKAEEAEKMAEKIKAKTP